jgi:hypothetical protein
MENFRSMYLLGSDQEGDFGNMKSDDKYFFVAVVVR